MHSVDILKLVNWSECFLGIPRLARYLRKSRAKKRLEVAFKYRHSFPE